MTSANILLTIISILLAALGIMAGIIVSYLSKIATKVDMHAENIAGIDKKLDTHIAKCSITHKFLEIIDHLDQNKREEILATIDNINKR